MKENDISKIGGVPANYLVIPLLVVIAVLHVVIIVLALKIDGASMEINKLMQQSAACEHETIDLQTGAGILTEATAAYIRSPVDEDGSANVGPLLDYAEELERDRRGTQIAGRFRDYGVSAEAQSYIDTAADESEKMYSVQLHAIALVRSVYPLPTIRELGDIPGTPLTRDEIAMTEEARISLAAELIFGQHYSRHRLAFGENLSACRLALQKEIADVSVKSGQRIKVMRNAMWVAIALIIVILTAAFTLFYRWLIRPLRSYARLIIRDQELKQHGAIRELRLVAATYNDLQYRRGRLEAILRSAAETDALTGLLNRYSFDRCALAVGEEDGPMALLLFDLNFLKRINDTQGHLIGDRTLRTAADCISECFGSHSGGSCFRIGGDEFAAVMRGLSDDELQSCIDRFRLALERENISVSFGCASEEKADAGSFRRLMNEADKLMYEEKKRVHSMQHRSEA